MMSINTHRRAVTDMTKGRRMRYSRRRNAMAPDLMAFPMIMVCGVALTCAHDAKGKRDCDEQRCDSRNDCYEKGWHS